MTAETENRSGIARYESLGLIGNPFKIYVESGAPITDLEVTSKSNELLKAILQKSREDAPKPLWVDKSEEIPGYYYMAALAGAESVLATDDDLNVLYALVELFTMRDGVTRSALRILSERLSWRSFDRTLVPYLSDVLANTDTALPSYQVMGPEALEVFTKRFEADPIDAIHTYLGDLEDERRPEFSDVVDYRPGSYDQDVLDENDETSEIDPTVADAPGTGALHDEPEPEPGTSDADVAAVRDYLIEYTSTHLSTVIARALRVYHDRGLITMAQEYRVTKAPRKTLAAVARLARWRYRKVALLFDSFEQWLDIDPDLRSKIAGSMSEMRWKLAGDAFMVFFLAPGQAPELEEMFRGTDLLDWTYAELADLQTAGDKLDLGTADRWLASASLSETPLTSADPVLAELAGEANDSFLRFAQLAEAAIENAAGRGVDSLDDESRSAALAAVPTD